MKHQFNAAALAKLSKQELLVLKANLIAEFNSVLCDQQKASIQHQIAVLQSYLN